MLLSKIKKFFINILIEEQNAKKLALTFCLANFIAWSATVPFQTPLLLLLSKIFKLNSKIIFTLVFIINNPLTIIPIYLLDYNFGSWLFNSVLKINIIKYNPTWAEKFSNFLNKYINLSKIIGESHFCFWCLIIGSLILPIIINIFLYPILKKMFSTLIKKYVNPKI